MTHTNTHSPRKIAGNALIALGAISMALGSQLQMEAQLLGQLSGQGSAMVEHMAGEPMLLQQSSVHAAALAPESSAGILAFGMLMMLLGFGLHAWIVLQNDTYEDRTVRVHAADPSKNTKAGKPIRKTRKPMEVIWIERTIRF